jgi:hypothetical protein
VPVSIAENQLRQVYSHLGSGLTSVRVEAFTGAGGRILVDFYIGELSLFFLKKGSGAREEKIG